MLKKNNSFRERVRDFAPVYLGMCLFVFGSLSVHGQALPEQPELLPAEEIQQGRNKGVTTWEGTLFGQDSYKPNSYAQIEVVPNPGFEFEKWEGPNIGNTEEAKTFVTMSDHLNIKPHYRRIWNVIAAPDNKEAGEVKGSGNYPDGSDVKLSVEPNEGFKFLGWEGKGIDEASKEELEVTITVDGDHDIVARFENENQDDGGGGGGGGDSDQNQDQNEDQNEDQQDEQEQNQDEQNQDQSDQENQPEEPQDPGEEENQGGEDEEPQQPEEGEEDPAEPEEGDEQEDQADQGEEEQQPEEPGGEEEAPAQETAADGQPIPMQMTPEEAIRLLEAMEDGEKKLPLFIELPPNRKDSKKDW